MSDFKTEGNKLIKYEGNAKNVEIPDGIVVIDENAFAGCASLTSLAIPMGAEVKKAAFKGCDCEITYRGKKYSAGKYSGIYKK